MRNEPMRRNDLPETCFSVLPSSGQLIIIKKGESGYYPSEWDTGSREENREIASSHNARRGITDIQEAAMLAGSMFGWNTPGANPQWYLDNARYVNSNIVQGHIKDPIMSVYYPVSSFLLCYEIMGKQHFYLPMDKLPQELMGQRSQFTINWLREQPDSPLRDFDSMNRCCDRYERACAIKSAMFPSCGFMVKTKQYVYMLRCTPIKGDYQFYIYCYQRKPFEKAQKEQQKSDRLQVKKRTEPER